MHQPLRAGRRQMLAGLSAVAAGVPGAVRAEPGASTLLVAGPPGGRMDQWADQIAPTIGHNLPGRGPLTRQTVGGLDGVTAANQFHARTDPDGTTALLVPGHAILCWMAGESRARFDPSTWVPVWGSSNQLTLYSSAEPVPGRPLRLAANSLIGLELPAILTLDLLGVEPILSPPSGASAMVAPLSEATLAMAAQAGMQPRMSFGVPGVSATAEAAAVPLALDLVRSRAPDETLRALQAISTAAQIEAGLVVPSLAGAASVAVWRHACAPLAQNADVMQAAKRFGAQPIGLTSLASLTAAQTIGPATLLTLRRWLAVRFDWRPS